jgi:hypothetical protein
MNAQRLANQSACFKPSRDTCFVYTSANAAFR